MTTESKGIIALYALFNTFWGIYRYEMLFIEINDWYYERVRCQWIYCLVLWYTCCYLTWQAGSWPSYGSFWAFIMALHIVSFQKNTFILFCTLLKDTYYYVDVSCIVPNNINLFWIS